MHGREIRSSSPIIPRGTGSESQTLPARCSCDVPRGEEFRDALSVCRLDGPPIEERDPRSAGLTLQCRCPIALHAPTGGLDGEPSTGSALRGEMQTTGERQRTSDDVSRFGDDVPPS